MNRNVKSAFVAGTLWALHAAGAQVPAPQAGAQVQTPAAASMLDQAPAPATIDFSADRLTIHAANSSLRAILNQLGSVTGVRVQGLTSDVRIFGVYGPGSPQDVLSALLDDSGYNVLIAGKKPDGSPREVVLSARVTDPSAAAAPAGTRTQAAEEDDDGDDNNAPPPQPAFFAPPPQQQIPGATGAPAAAAPQIRTPQQMFEELQRMHQAATQAAPQ